MYRWLFVLVAATASGASPVATTQWESPYSSWDSPQISMVVDGTDSIYTFSLSNRVAILDKWSLTFEKTWSRVVHSSTPYISNLQLDGSGNVWAGASSNVVKFSASGEILRTLRITDFTYGFRYLAVASNVVYAAETRSTSGKVFKFGQGVYPEWWDYTDILALNADSAGNLVLSERSTYGNRTSKVTPSGAELWSVAAGGDAAIAANGDVYVCDVPTGRFWATKIDALGAIQWRRRYTAPDHWGDGPGRIKVDANGSVYVAGISSSGPGDTILVKYASDGELLWVNRWMAARDAYFQTVYDLAIQPNGLVAVTGRFWHGNDADQRIGTATLAYDTNGVRVFEATHGTATNNFDGGRAVAFDSAGNIYVAAVSWSRQAPWRYHLYRYAAPPLQDLPRFTVFPTNALTTPGATVTLSGVGSNAATYQWVRDDIPIPGETGQVLTLTNVQRSDRADFWLVLSNAAGAVASPVARLWFPPLLASRPENLSVFAGDSAMLNLQAPLDQPELTFEWWKDGLLVASTSRLALPNVGGSNYGDYVIRAIDSLGAVTETAAWLRPPAGVDLLWSRRQVDASKAVGLVVLPDHSVFLVGNEERTPLPDYFIVKRYGPNGEDDWRVYFNPGQEVSAAAVLAAPGGQIYVAGTQKSTRGDLDFLLVCYGTNGAELASLTWDSGQALDDKVTACAIDSAGAVYLTGESRNGAFGVDVMVLKVTSRTNAVWHARYSGLTNVHEIARAITVDADGTTYVSGQAVAPDDTRPLMVSISSAGVVRWARTREPLRHLNSTLWTLALDESGIYAAGNIGIVKFDRSGAEIWSRTYFGGRQMEVADICLGGANDLYATGTATWRLRASDGTVEWVNASDLKTSLMDKVAFDPSLQQVYVATAARMISGFRAVDGVSLWFVTGADLAAQWLPEIDMAARQGGGVIVASSTFDGMRDCLTRCYLPAVGHSLPNIVGDRALPVLPGAYVRLSNALSGTGLQFQWERNGQRILGETNAAMTIPAASLADDGLYTLEAWDGSNRWALPAWRIILHPTLLPPMIYNVNGVPTAYIGAERPPGVTYMLQVSTNLVDWKIVTALPHESGFHGEPLSNGTSFFRAYVAD